MQTIGAGGANIEGAPIAHIPVIADVVIDALVLLPALVKYAAVIEPIDQGLGAGRDRVAGLAERCPYHVLEGGAQLWRSIHARTKRGAGGIMQVARHHKGESQGGVVEL